MAGRKPSRGHLFLGPQLTSRVKRIGLKEGRVLHFGTIEERNTASSVHVHAGSCA